MGQGGLQWVYMHLDARNGFSGPKTYKNTYFMAILRHFGQIWRPPEASKRLLAAAIDENHVNMAEIDLATQKKKKEMTYVIS